VATKVYHSHQTQRVASDPHWSVNCTAYCGAMMITDATLGGTKITGRQVRAMSSEPKPDAGSPGLNLSQIHTVAAQLHVAFTDMSGHSWQEAVRAMDEGRRVQLAVDYKSLGGYRCQAGGDFGHAVVMVKVSAASRANIVCSDPLCSAVKVYPSTVLHTAAEKFARDTGILRGIRFAVTRPVPRVEA
jgi:hypothetical protein